MRRMAPARGRRIAAIVIVLAALGASALTATAATNRHRDTVNITWMMFETPNLPLSYWQDIVNRFEAKNPGIHGDAASVHDD